MNELGSTARELVNEVVFLRGQPLSLIVEGDSDRVLLAGIFGQSQLTLLVANSKTVALEVVHILEQEPSIDSQVANLAVLVDRDDDAQSGWRGRLLRTKGRDLDAEIAAVPGTLERVLRSVHRIADDEQMTKALEFVTESAHVRRAVREAAFRLGLGLHVDRLNARLTRQVISDLTSIPDALGVKSQKAGFVNAVREALGRTRMVYECCGHDIHLVISWEAKAFGRDQVQSTFMSAVGPDQFRSTATGKALEMWANDNGLSLWRASAQAA